MEDLISETLQIAREKFSAFGFKEEQIDQLLTSGRNDLEKELHTLAALLETEETDIENLNQSLHALKGLLYNMGNMEAGNIMNELRTEGKVSERIDEIKKIVKR